MTLKRTPLRRRTPLRPGGPLDRRTPLRVRVKISPRNDERRRRLFLRAYGSEERVAWIRRQPCAVPGCGWRHGCHNAHVLSKGAGGTADDVVPLCGLHHHQQHQLGAQTFEERHGVDLCDLAAEYARRWRERGDGDDA